MRLVCPDTNNMCKIYEFPNPLNVPGIMYVSWLHVDKWDQLNMLYAMWTMGFKLVMVDDNYHTYPNAGLSSQEYAGNHLQRFTFLWHRMNTPDFILWIIE